ncbi:MAG: hypothetical protein PGN09_04545 [Sphingomonas fennica]
MPAFTTNQWAILFLVLVLGWVLGLASRAGGGRWKRALAEEQEARAEAERGHREELSVAHARIKELEREAAARPAAAPVAAPVAPRAVRDDDLGIIRGIGPVGADRLGEQGVTRYRQIVALDAAGKADLERRLGAPEGTIDRDDWQGQAKLLDDGRLDDHARRYG